MRKSAPVRFGRIKARPPPAYPGMRIGLLGGSFNPPHDGHRLITQTALKRLGLDQVWWLVTPGNPLKDHGALPTLEERMALCRAMMPGARVKITGFEADLATPYSAATLAFLTARFRATRFVWIIGADNLVQMHRWRQWRDVFQSVPIAVAARPGWRLAAMSSRAAASFWSAKMPESRARLLAGMKPPAWTMLGGRLCDRSSSAIRKVDVKTL